jgi:hypothetical protein
MLAAQGSARDAAAGQIGRQRLKEGLRRTVAQPCKARMRKDEGHKDERVNLKFRISNRFHLCGLALIFCP